MNAQDNAHQLDEKDEVIILNNRAANLIKGGDIQQALAPLRHALKTAKKILESITDDDYKQVRTINQNEANQERPVKVAITLDECLVQSYGDQEMDTNGHLTCNGMHCHPLMFPTLHRHHNFTESSTLQILAAIIFNLALAHQLHANNAAKGVDKQDASRMIRQAVTLYESSWGLLKEYESTIESSSSSCAAAGGGTTMNVLFALTILNNVGACYESLNDSSATNHCYQQLVSSLMVMIVDNKVVVDTQDTPSSVAASTTRQHLIESLFQNAYLNRTGNSRRPRTAAAA